MSIPFTSLVIIFFWVIFIVYWVMSASGAKRTISTVGRGSDIWMRILILIPLVLIMELPVFNSIRQFNVASPLGSVLRYGGVFFCAVGIGFAIWARRHIGRNWGMPRTLKENPELVTSGPYAYVRHPIYTGILLAIFGSALASNVLWLIPFLYFVIFFIYSARVEERLMAQQFPEIYPAYQKRTKMLIPFIY